MAAYDTPGAFTGGVWLVVGHNRAFFASRDQLPPTGSGYRYWWIGATEDQFNNRVVDAFGHLNVTPPTNYNLDANTNSTLHKLLHQGGTVDVGTGNFFTSGAQNAAIIPPLGGVGAAVQAGAAEGGGAAGGAEAGAAGAAGAAGGGGAAAAAAKAAADAAAKAAASKAGLAGIAAILAALFSPHLFYILGGFVLLLFAVLIIIKQPIKSR